jgi:hypothetical protein
MTHERDIIERGSGAEWIKPVGHGTDSTGAAVETTAPDRSAGRLEEQIGSCMERRERLKAGAATEVADVDRGVLYLSGVGFAVGFFAWMFWLMADFDSARNSWLGAGFWVGVGVSSSACVAAFILRRKNITRIVKDVARDLEAVDSEVKTLRRQIVGALKAGGDGPRSLAADYRYLRAPLDPFTPRSRALSQLVCAAILIALTGMVFFSLSTSQSSKAPVDRLAEYRTNVGRTAYNATSGVEIGRIVGVEVTRMNGPEQVVYKIDREGRLVSFPVSNVVVRGEP